MYICFGFFTAFGGSSTDIVNALRKSIDGSLGNVLTSTGKIDNSFINTMNGERDRQDEIFDFQEERGGVFDSYRNILEKDNHEGFDQFDSLRENMENGNFNGMFGSENDHDIPDFPKMQNNSADRKGPGNVDRQKGEGEFNWNNMLGGSGSGSNPFSSSFASQNIGDMSFNRGPFSNDFSDDPERRTKRSLKTQMAQSARSMYKRQASKTLVTEWKKQRSEGARTKRSKPYNSE